MSAAKALICETRGRRRLMARSLAVPKILEMTALITGSVLWGWREWSLGRVLREGWGGGGVVSPTRAGGRCG